MTSHHKETINSDSNVNIQSTHKGMGFISKPLPSVFYKYALTPGRLHS